MVHAYCFDVVQRDNYFSGEPIRTEVEVTMGNLHIKMKSLERW